MLSFFIEVAVLVAVILICALYNKLFIRTGFRFLIGK